MNRKLRGIYIIYEKRGQPPEISENFFFEISVPFDFHRRISGTFGRIVRFSEIQQFPEFWNLFLKFRNVWWNGKRPTTAAKTSQNKSFNESYNGSARVINLCTFPSQPIQNKQLQHGDIVFIKRFLHKFSCT